MQPNEQEPNPSQPNSSPMPGQEGPQPYTSVPEFLHMEPVTDPLVEQKRKKKPKMIIVIVLAIAVVVAGVVGIVFWLQGANERSLYAMLDEMMRTSYVVRKLNVTSSNNGTTTLIDAETDFSTPAQPKSKISYDNHQSANTKNTSKANQLKGDMVVLSNAEYYSRLTLSSITLPKSTSLNQWYVIPAAKTSYSTVQDYLGLRFSMNNTLSQVAIGKYTDDQRSKILSFIKANNVYKVEKSEQKESGGNKLTVLDVRMNYQKLKDLNGLINKELNVKNIATSLTGESKAEFWIDNNTGRLGKVVESVSLADGISANGEIQYSYPGTVNITKPTDVMGLE